MVNIEQVNDILKISYVDENGDIKISALKVPSEEMFNWEYTKTKGDKKFISWDKKPIKKVKSKYLNKYRMVEYFASQPQEYQDLYFNVRNIPKMYFVDIETQILDEFPSNENPKSIIYTIAIADQENNIIVLGLKDLSDKDITSIKNKLNKHFSLFNIEFNFKYIKYETEFDMLYTFLAKFVKKMPLITGWNFTGFDWPYIIARSRRLGIDVEICSPTGKMKTVNLPLNDNTDIRVDLPYHKIVVDYLQVYKKWDNRILIKESDTLDYVAEQALKIKKVSYNGTLTDLYRDNFQDYVFYNAVDAHLVKLIHDQLNSIYPYLALSNLTRVEHHHAFSAKNMIENILALELLNHNKILVLDTNKEKPKGEKFKGAYVFPVEKGFHKWVLAFDFASLYPSTIRQHKISPETYLGKIASLPKLLDDDKIYCANGAVFEKTDEGALPILMSKIYKQRKDYKNIYGEIEAEVLYLKNILKNKK